MGKEGVILEDGIYIAIKRRGLADINTIDLDEPRVREFKSGDQTEHSGLT